MTSLPRFWIGVASRDHVRAGVAGGFCQLCHGKAAPLRRMQPGDRIAYYSPRTAMRGGAPVQAFTAIGEVVAGAPYPFDMGGGLVPHRRDVRFLPAHDAAIAPLLETLSFTRGRRSWGVAFRRGVFEATAADHAAIAAAMGVADLASRVSDSRIQVSA